ncbi:hypothetical protein WDW37_02615 [Bdellovibrionota bacterium FG-1]
MLFKSQLYRIVGLGVGLAVFAAETRAETFKVMWNATGPEQELISWNSEGLGKLKSVSTHEKDPLTGKLTQYKGVLLSKILEKSMNGLTVDRKAQIDLLIFKNASGGQVLVPRSVVTKYPVLLALKGDQVSLVMPWTSKPKMMQEGLPVETYFLADVSRLDLSNYQERYGNLLLKRRTDPLAVRGEKIFVQNCISCHSNGKISVLTEVKGDSILRGLAGTAHLKVKGSPKLTERDLKSLLNYLGAYRVENTLAK